MFLGATFAALFGLFGDGIWGIMERAGARGLLFALLVWADWGKPTGGWFARLSARGLQLNRKRASQLQFILALAACAARGGHAGADRSRPNDDRDRRV